MGLFITIAATVDERQATAGLPVAVAVRPSRGGPNRGAARGHGAPSARHHCEPNADPGAPNSRDSNDARNSWGQPNMHPRTVGATRNLHARQMLSETCFAGFHLTDSDARLLFQLKRKRSQRIESVTDSPWPPASGCGGSCLPAGADDGSECLLGPRSEQARQCSTSDRNSVSHRIHEYFIAGHWSQ